MHANLIVEVGHDNAPGRAIVRDAESGKLVGNVTNVAIDIGVDKVPSVAVTLSRFRPENDDGKSLVLSPEAQIESITLRFLEPQKVRVT